MVILHGIKNITGTVNAVLTRAIANLIIHFSPYYNESHIRVRDAVREWVDKEIIPFCHEWSENKEIPKSVLKRAAQVGILAAVSGAGTDPKMAHLLPYGLPGGVTSAEFDIFHEFICIDELARCGSGGLIWALEGGLSIVSSNFTFIYII